MYNIYNLYNIGYLGRLNVTKLAEKLKPEI